MDKRTCNAARYGVPAGDSNPAAKDAASWNFGYITEQVKVPNMLAKIIAGLENTAEFIRHPVKHKHPSLHYGMNLADAENMDAGIEAAKKAIGFHKSLPPISASRFISVAPTRPARQSAKPKPAAFQRSESESFHTSLRQMAKSSAAIGINQEIKNFIKALTPARSGLSHEIVQAIAGVRALSKDLISVSRAGASLSPLLASRRSKLNNDPAAIQLAPFHLAASLGARRSATLPSFAPIANTGRNSGAVGLGRTGTSVNPFTSAGSTTASATSDPTMQPQMDQWQFSEMLSRELDRQARLPPSGATGFDPRLSPAWPGMKLPN